MTTETHTPGAHSVFGPSSASRWLTCPASVPLTKYLRETGALPARDPSGEAAIRGSAIHAVTATAYEFGITARQAYDKPELRAEVEKMLSDPVAAHIDIDDVLAVADQFATQAELEFGKHDPELVHLEERVALKAHPGVFGTADYARVRRDDAEELVLTIADFKSGAWRVDARANAQLYLYAEMFCQTHEVEPARVEMVILQPTIDGDIRTDWHIVAYAKVKEFVRDTILPAVEDALSDDPTFAATEQGCRFCPARAYCPELGKISQQLMEETDVKALNPDQVVKFYDNWKTLAGVKDQIEDLVRSGHITKGFELKPGSKRQGWDKAKVDAWLDAEPGRREQFMVPATPAAVKKIDKAAHAAAVESGTITYTESAARVVRDQTSSDDAESLFGKDL